jgi:hypothetical protein
VPDQFEARVNETTSVWTVRFSPAAAKAISTAVRVSPAFWKVNEGFVGNLRQDDPFAAG